jgi:hypothetical protein
MPAPLGFSTSRISPGSISARMASQHAGIVRRAGITSEQPVQFLRVHYDSCRAACGGFFKLRPRFVRSERLKPREHPSMLELHARNARLLAKVQTLGGGRTRARTWDPMINSQQSALKPLEIITDCINLQLKQMNGLQRNYKLSEIDATRTVQGAVPGHPWR